MSKREGPALDQGALPFFPVDSFVGRQNEIETLKHLLSSGEQSVITVLGPGGVGKTRLVLEAVRNADEWTDRSVAIAMLAIAQRDTEIVRAIADAMGIVDHEEQLRDRISEALSQAPYMLVLDNLEHLVDGARACVEWLLGVAPETRIVSTSRIALELDHEERVELSPFTVSGGLAEIDLIQHEAVRLFLDRARNPKFRVHDGDLQRIAALCSRYDGLPLAIELVASWANVLTPEEMLARHDDDFEDRGTGREARHRTIDDAIRWSYELLDPAEQALLRRMSLFTGGFSKDLVEGMLQGSEPGTIRTWAHGYELIWRTAEQEAWGGMPIPHESHVIALPHVLPALDVDCHRAIASLLDHHLILPPEDIDGVLVFGMLETIREFGQKELENRGELEGARQTHALAMMAFSEASSDFFWGGPDPKWGIERAMAAVPSIRAALRWFEQQGEVGRAFIVRIAGPFWAVYQTRGLITEGRYWLETAMELPQEFDWLKGTELPALAFLRWIQNDDKRAIEAVAAAEGAMTRTGKSHIIGFCHLIRALVLYRQEQPDLLETIRQVDAAEENFEKWGVPHGLVGCRAIYGVVARMLGDSSQALQLFDEAREIAIEARYEWGIAVSYYFAGETLREMAAADESHLPAATAMMLEALERMWRQGDAWTAGGALSGLACIRVHRGEPVEAAMMFGAASVLMQRVGGSLLPADLMTHAETSERLSQTMGIENYQTYFAMGAMSPEATVEKTLRELSDNASPTSGAGRVHLTKRQKSVLHDLAKGYDPPIIAVRRGRSESATYEIVNRMAERLGVDTWEEIVPAAIEKGLLDNHR